jgi:hypothetical protein
MNWCAGFHIVERRYQDLMCGVFITLREVQSSKIIMTGIKLIPVTFSFEIDLWSQLYEVLLYIRML